MRGNADVPGPDGGQGFDGRFDGSRRCVVRDAGDLGTVEGEAPRTPGDGACLGDCLDIVSTNKGLIVPAFGDSVPIHLSLCDTQGWAVWSDIGEVDRTGLVGIDAANTDTNLVVRCRRRGCRSQAHEVGCRCAWCK